MPPSVEHKIGPLTARGAPFLPPGAYTKRRETRYIVIHCSDTPGHLDVNANLIRDWHIKERGWSDIGYHLVIRRDGTLELGRPQDTVGAGVVGHNAYSFHICLVGGRGKDKGPENNFTPEQFNALRLTCAALIGFYRGVMIQGHRDFPGVDKACPSFDARKWWEQERVKAVEYLERVTAKGGA